MKSLPIYINGKFYEGALNGVHRVSDRLIQEIDTLWENTTNPPVKLLVPSRKRGEIQPQFKNITVCELDDSPSQMWEQWHLPRYAQDGILVNLANLAPLRHKRKITLIHDAQFVFPDNSYPLRQRLGYRLLTPHMAKSSAIVMTVSDYSRRMLDVMGIASAAQSHVLYNGVDHILDAPADDTILVQKRLQSRGYVLMFGSYKAYKNNAIVFEAYRQSQLHDIPLVVVGDGREKLIENGFSIPNEAIFVGKCSDTQLRALYENARCVLCPSRTEGFGLPPLEAMLCRTPAVITPAGALPEVCRDAAVYADVDNPQTWVDAIRSLEPETAFYAQKVQAGYERARTFTWARAGQELAQAMLKLSHSSA